MLNNIPKALVFTDLDGTFLDHDTYRYDEALPALKRLQSENIPVIAVTSKTIAEIEHLKLPFGNTPRIGENGMVIQIPVPWRHNKDSAEFHYPAGKTYKDITNFIDTLPHSLRENIKGFNDMSVEDVITCTSLPNEHAKRAKTRLASEPFLWTGTDEDLKTLAQLANAQNLSLTQGGRFYHLIGQSGKDKAIQWLLENMPSPNTARLPITIALGDGPNDAEMLACVDYGIKIPSASGKDFQIKSPKKTILKATFSGPRGWNQTINSLLDELKIDD